MIVLCQNSSDRVEMIVKLLDCAHYLFETIHNLYAFAYIMEAFEHEQVIDQSVGPNISRWQFDYLSGLSLNTNRIKHNQLSWEKL